MKKGFIAVVIWILSLPVQAQNSLFNTQYYQIAPAVNPGFTGIDNFLDIKINFRNEWSGFTESPSTSYLAVSGNLKKETQASSKQYSLRTSNPSVVSKLYKKELSIAEKLRHGIGGYLLLDKQGPFKQLIGSVNYAIHIPLSGKTTLAMGVSGNINNKKIDYSSITLRDDNDDYYQNLLSEGSKNTYLEINPGVVFYGKHYYISYSPHKLFRSPLSSDQTEDQEKFLDHYILAGTNFNLSESVRMQPSLLFNSNEVYGASWAFTAKTVINEKGFGAISYKSSKVLAFMAGINLNNLLNLTYSYDLQVSSYSRYMKGAHEVTLGLMLFKTDLRAPYL